jgi:nitrate reductase cytochrome c-type subunit
VYLKCDHFDAFETDSFCNVEDGYEEVTVIEDEPSEDPNANKELTEDEQAERDIIGKEISVEEQWNEGEIEVNINRCLNCHTHYEYSRHSEDAFVDAFNDAGNAIQ